MTKKNKEIIEHTSAVIKYKEGQAYVAGESEINPIRKVHEQDVIVLSQGKKAEFQSSLKNINLKFAFQDSRNTQKFDNHNVVQQVTKVDNLFEEAKKL
jgi:hypothetical protein